MGLCSRGIRGQIVELLEVFPGTESPSNTCEYARRRLTADLRFIKRGVQIIQHVAADGVESVWPVEREYPNLAAELKSGKAHSVVLSTHEVLPSVRGSDR